MLPPQREDAAGLRGRLEAIDAELDDVRNQARRLAALERERAKLEAERAEVASRLGAYGRRLELEDLRVASPCKADWDAMRGNDQVRFCLSCQKNVYNLSGMTRDEATAFVRQNEGGEICVRMYRRADDTVLTGDCPEGARRKRRRLAFFGAGGGVVMAAAASAQALWPAGKGCEIEQGKMATGVTAVPTPAIMGSVALPQVAAPPRDEAQQAEGGAGEPKPEGGAASRGGQIVGRMPIRRPPPAPGGGAKAGPKKPLGR
ncbi:MAG TPA: hypothetical protein VFS43_32850 [Polyangiaceae bacterium]|nr:hypothetical protein [Polyangiaceae bacterium]